MKYLKLITIAFSLFSFISTGWAEDRGTREEAKQLALEAASFLSKMGEEKAFSEFQNPEGIFRKKDLYVFVQDFKCNFFAHGLNPKLVGKNIWNLKNPNGRFACQDIVHATQKDGQAWTDYIFQDPHTGKLAEKTTFSIEVGHYIVMVGVYK
ncbi:putative cache sensor protein [Candidatus Terasakiella magnetica]|uniref:Putative cache sensor protein n=1 Tax=Candidatus Terasakiella magnetica TaxID=1867952 RepID=A0A1C3RCZ3_9PROT|nr:cache domain-containing protein [Candidatus Terasakiella magnetica]SCA55150.1 putative cache sensor protein [Candidatus Terasakiella magnetica]